MGLLHRRVPAWSLVATLAAAALAALAPAPAAAMRTKRHTDPVRAFPRGGKIRPTARISALGPFNTSSWQCTEQTQDLPEYWGNAPQVKVLYVHPTNWSSRLKDGVYNYGNLIQADAAAVRTKVATTAGSARSVRFDVGGTGGTCTGNSGQYLDIQTIALSNPAAYYSGDNAYPKLVSELRQKVTPPTGGRRITYVVYADGIGVEDGVIGEADMPNDTRHSLENAANQGEAGRGGLFGIVYGDAGSTYSNFTDEGPSLRQEAFLHELTHTIGGVQYSAPHSSQKAHCFDEQDIMCYLDGGPYFERGGELLDPAVTGCYGFGFDQQYDCNQDDYFNPNPPAGSYLAQHWNTYDSVYLCPVDDCDTQGTPPSEASISRSIPGGHVALTANVTSAKPVAHYEWDIDGNGIYDVDTGTNPVLNPNFNSDLPRTVWMRASTADGSFRLASLANVQPVTPQPAFEVRGTREIGQTLELDATATQDPEGYITSFHWDLDGDNSYERDTGLGRTTTVSFADPQEVSLGLEVDYWWGYSFARTPITITGPGGVMPGVKSPGTGTPGSATTPVTFALPTLALSKISLKRLLSGGQPLSIKCGAPCVVQFSLSLDARTAKKFGLKSRRGKPVVIARLTGQFAAGITRPALKLTASAKRALKRARTLKVSISGRIAQGKSEPLRLAKVLTFKR